MSQNRLVSDNPISTARVVTVERNSTRYVVVLTKMPKGEALKGWLVTMCYAYSPQASMFVGEDMGPVFTHYVAEKMHISERDAEAVGEVIAEVLGVEHVTL